MIRTARTKATSILRTALAATLVATPTLLIPSVAASAATGELLLSEYIEGSSFNKSIEVFNGTGGAVDLGAGGYSLELYSNGSASVSQSVALTGTIADGDVFVVSHGSASAAILAQTDLESSAVANFNGDDGVVLRKGAAVVDAFGQNGVDPGSQWPGGGQNDTLQRMESVCAGDTNFDDAFDASIEWNVLAQDDISGLGSHTADCGASGPDELLLSEYIEGSSFNKSIEVFNGTGGAVDLGAGGYSLELYSNGSASVSQSVALTGTIADGDVFVVSHGSASAAILAQTDLESSAVANFNGDDGVVLRKGAAVVDAFGQNGVDPGSQWPGGGQNDTLQRMESVCAGDTNFDDAFDASIEWNVLAQDDISGLGSHTVSCAGGGAAPVIDCGAALAVEEGVAASTTVTASDADDTVVAMTLVGDDVLPVGSLIAGAFTPSAGVGDPATLGLNLDARAEPGVYTATIQAENSAGDTVGCDLTVQVFGLLLIHDVQGSGPTVAITGPVKVDAIVTSLVTNDDAISGFLLQEEDADADADPLTSEGILVTCGTVCPSDPALAVGDNVTVTGDAGELFQMSEIDASVGGSVTINSSGNVLPLATPQTLPAPDGTDEELTFEPLEGMLVEFTDELFVSEYFELARFGQVVLTADERPFQFTHENLPSVAGYAAFLDELATRRIVLDDDNNNQNDAISGAVDEPYYYPVPGFSTTSKFRGGDSITGLTGALDWAFGEWRVNPTPEAFDYTFTPNNTRPAAPDPVGGSLKVASFNVLNYFTTIDDGVNVCGPNLIGCRGANSAAELARQRDKIVSALAEIDADIVGLIEIENNADASLIDLVGGLNAVVGAGTYDYVDTGTVGGDAIKVAFIYKPATVDLEGDFKILDSSVDQAFIDTKNRPVLIQTFEETATGAAVTIAVNHLKSKGSSCADVGDPGLSDGQANCNLTRTAAATALVDYLATDPTGSGDPDFLIIGDLNAYAMEDPIAAITGAGYTDLIEQFGGPDSYSFVFDGQLGYLDHALANPTLLPSVTGVTEWHINADEVNVLDYNDDVQDPGEASFDRKSSALPIYEPNGFRSSDHDPLVIGLDMATARGLKESARDELAGLLPTGDRQADRSINKAIRRIDQSLNPDWWIDDSTLDPKKGKRVFDREYQAAKALEWVKAVNAQPAVDKLIEADRMLATTQLQIAIDAGADAHDVAKAKHLLHTAERYVRYGWYPKSIRAFRDAWKAAVKATPEPPVRFATFNASLNRNNEGDLAAELSAPGSAQPDVIAEIIQRNRPEVLLINEFDYDDGNVALDGFHENYLMVAHGDAEPIEYPYRYTAPSNTGIFSGFDLDNSGAAGDFVPNDSFGFGFFEGQFGMAVYSMHPIDFDDIRTFQNFLWKDMPGALLPEDPPGTPWYSPEELDVFRLSSKSHWDVPIDVDGETVHFLVSHPTPPVFDGPEDRNGTRNFDEIRFWADYASGDRDARYIYDDEGKKGGLKRHAKFVIAGDQNSDPLDGDSIPGAIQQLLDHPKVNTTLTPSSPGGPEQAALQGGINDTHLSDPAFDTADFNDAGPGNLRADYVLPSKNLPIRDAGVFWPLADDPLFSLVGTFPFPSSDHRLVWVDLGVDG